MWETDDNRNGAHVDVDRVVPRPQPVIILSTVVIRSGFDGCRRHTYLVLGPCGLP